ncbi:hypothetical protein B0A48_13453 [Cryoendolithus antarcticus]|uniref:Xylanolytic transcriptional activator regulatory domain-containing protein n=1 Tax=Cryoendolithus antarcticus TaxID=1507870 RepID=A0A1V8SQ78_9PEZI|nr:hypothetical protein B0A48_13453 [Cryoendolithus antarcticus]
MHPGPPSQPQQHLAPEQGYASSDRTPHDDAVDDTVAATDLQNPSDALDFLAQVAERDAARSPGERPHDQNAGAGAHAHGNGHIPSQQPTIYPLLQTGQLSVEMVSTLLLRYHDKYHPYFPIANVDAMTPQRLWTTASDQKHLLTAMLTVASRDVQEWQQTHEACSAHMQDLIANLVYAGTGSVEAIEALLILSEWPPRQPRCPSIGRGEEDAAAWMLVGTAIRIGYLLGIDRTGFRTANDGNTDGLDRKRLAWAACYISDRQISVRLGKAFWSRGPGPMTALGTRDFPSLKPKQPWQDDYAAIFQANLDLTQLFSNAHDVLYATKDRSQQLHMGGEYVKYIDDFRVSLRIWHSTWGMLSCSAPLKASVTLCYEYLRLYINAFAYQATLNRLVAKAQAASPNGVLATSIAPFADIASTPDARFIYEAIDAATSILSVFNSLDPLILRTMPLKLWLCVIYSGTFLYKARCTGVMGAEQTGRVKQMIHDAVDKLQKASTCANDVGDRYSRLLRLLWRKPPSRGDVNRAGEPVNQHTYPAGTSMPQQMGPRDVQQQMQNPASINAFSWLDLGAVGDFATTNNSLPSESLDGLDRFDDSSNGGFGSFDQGFTIPLQMKGSPSRSTNAKNGNALLNVPAGESLAKPREARHAPPLLDICSIQNIDSTQHVRIGLKEKRSSTKLASL